MRVFLVWVFMMVSALCLSQNKVLYHSLEVTYIGLNALDVVSTYKVIEYGGYEANPVMAKFVGNKAAFIGVKAVSTAVFLGACRIIKKDKPKLAFALLIAGNIGYGFLVNHNYQLSIRLKMR